MVRTLFRCLALVLAVLAGCAAPIPGFPLNQPGRPPAVAQAAWDASYMFVMPPVAATEEGGPRLCSATAIAPDVLVTARHCIHPGFKGGAVAHPAGRGAAVLQVAVAEDADVALLRVAGPPLASTFAAEVHEGMQAHVLGYGCAGGLKLEARPVEYVGRLDTGELDNPVMDVYRGVACRGDSGGGIFDEAGRLVGVTIRIAANGEPVLFAVPAVLLAE